MEVQQKAVHSDLSAYLPSLRNAIAMAVAEYNGIYDSRSQEDSQQKVGGVSDS